jgi:two-component system sensor histidine kinase/response regulator
MAENVVQDQAPARQALLLVDDSPANLLAYRAVLEPLGHELVEATSGTEAVRLLAGRQFALLLIDVRMPDVDGFETVDLLRRRLQRATPVIFVTGASDNQAMRRAYEFGAVDYLVKPVDPDVLRGKVHNLLALYEQGIELERRAALLLQQQQQLAQANEVARQQDTNMGVLAHDLRNPLNVIVTGTQLLRRVPALPDQAQKIADRIDRSARRMGTMIRDILDFARGRLGGGIPLNRQAADLAALCTEITDEVQAAYPGAIIDVHMEGELQGSWDNARIEQALSNLIVNAIQHGVGSVTLTLSGRAGDHAVVTVRNGGPPIPAEQLPNLFDAFRRGGKSPAGLGLGLFIVREIVRAHDGTIEVASSSGGTTFTMRLPRESPASNG